MNSRLRGNDGWPVTDGGVDKTNWQKIEPLNFRGSRYIGSTAGLHVVSGSECADLDYRKVSTSAGLETRMSWTASGVNPLYSILGAMWSSMYE